MLGIFHFFSEIATGIGKNWYQKKVSELVSERLVLEKVSEPVSVKFGAGKKFWNQYWKNLVLELIFIAEI